MTSQSTGHSKPGRPGRPVFGESMVNPPRVEMGKIWGIFHGKSAGESLGNLVGDWDVSRINRSIVYIYICIIMHIIAYQYIVWIVCFVWLKCLDLRFDDDFLYFPLGQSTARHGKSMGISGM